MNTFHSLVPVILVQLISQVRCVDHRRGIHKLLHRPHKLPGLVPPHYPPSSDNPYTNYPPFNPFMPNPFSMNPYRMPPMYQPPFASPFGFTPNMQSAFPFPKFSSQYQPPSEYAAEEPEEDFSASSSESTYMTPNSPSYSYMPPNPQSSYTSPTSSYMPSNPSSYSPSSTFMPSILPPNYSSPSYMAPNQQYNYFTPSQPSFVSNPPTSFAMPSSPSYFTPNVPSYMPTTTQSAYVTPASQPSYIAPNPQPAVQSQSPQAYVTPYATPQALVPTGYPTNQTFTVPTQQQVLPALPITSSISSADNSTIVPGIATENATQINSTMPVFAPINPSPDLSQNTVLPDSPQAADETPLINSNGETSTDMNSLPPQVKEFIDMIPNILAMPDSQAMAPKDQMQQLAEGKPRLSPFSLHKPHKKLPLHKRKSLFPPSSYYPPSYPPSYPPPGYPVPPYQSPPYQPQLPLSLPSY